jgi:predicted metal-dependent HD superfamily phosphohydrolase
MTLVMKSARSFSFVQRYRLNDLRPSWLRAWHGLGAHSDGEPIYEALLSRYREPHRKYHSLQHLTECLQGFEAVKSLPQHPAEVEMALWFHDAIYEVKRSDNEEQSAQWAKSALLNAQANPDAAQRVFDLILITQHTGVPQTQDEQVLIDIDLGILGADEARFAEYEQQIRHEYEFVPAGVFKQKRRAILQSFLDRPHIYSTPHFRLLLEERARRNLAQAIGLKDRSA